MLVTTGFGAQGHWEITAYGLGKYRLFIKLCKISLVKDIRAPKIIFSKKVLHLGEPKKSNFHPKISFLKSIGNFIMFIR